MQEGYWGKQAGKLAAIACCASSVVILFKAEDYTSKGMIPSVGVMAFAAIVAAWIWMRAEWKSSWFDWALIGGFVILGASHAMAYGDRYGIYYSRSELSIPVAIVVSAVTFVLVVAKLADKQST